jgi:thymidylate kinase
MLIILEGPDGAGKSTLTRELAEYVHARVPSDVVKVTHKGPPQLSSLAEYEGPLLRYRPNVGKHIICDRWHIGELIYPYVLNRKSDMDDVVFEHIELFLKARGALLVHVTAPLDVLDARIRANGDELITPGMIPVIVARYKAIFEITTKLAPIESISPQNIVETASMLDEAYVRLNSFTTYVGPRYPDLLLFGDRRNVPVEQVQVPSPAFMPYPNTSGHFLLRALHDRTKELPRFGLANACDVDDPRALWEALDEPKTVALGKNADSKLDFPHTTVDHPQYVRRFHHPEIMQYVNHILFDKVPVWKS